MPIAPEAREAMFVAWANPANAGSPHILGELAAASVAAARATIAELIGASASEIVFTSGATEANNLALIGIARWALETGNARQRIIVSAVEHKAILEPAHWLKALGFEVIVAPVDHRGAIDCTALSTLVDERTLLVSVMAANNETGVVQPVAEAPAIAHDAGALLLCDAVQAAGKMPLDFAALGADMLMLGGHKIGAPMGIGALIIREGLPFAALAVGGGQETRRRAGSENVPGIAGFGAAARAAREGLEAFAALGHLRDTLEDEVARIAPDAVFFGKGAERLSNTSYLSAPGLDAETLLMALDLDGIAVSAGAACSSGKIGRPRVLDAMGVSGDLSRGAVRVSLGWSSGAEDIDRFVRSWSRVYERTRAQVNASVTASVATETPLAAVES